MNSELILIEDANEPGLFRDPSGHEYVEDPNRPGIFCRRLPLDLPSIAAACNQLYPKVQTTWALPPELEKRLNEAGLVLSRSKFAYEELLRRARASGRENLLEIALKSKDRKATAKERDEAAILIAFASTAKIILEEHPDADRGTIMELFQLWHPEFFSLPMGAKAKRRFFKKLEEAGLPTIGQSRGDFPRWAKEEKRQEEKRRKNKRD